MEPPQDSAKPVEPPRGIYTSRVDDKGRLKLPRDFERFLRTFDEQQLFITTTDGDTARVYPIQQWRQNEKIFQGHTQNPKAAARVAFLADYWGAMSEVDAQGRVLIPPGLRRKLAIENQPVYVRFYNGAVDVYSEAVSEKRLQSATETLPADLEELQKVGLT